MDDSQHKTPIENFRRQRKLYKERRAKKKEEKLEAKLEAKRRKNRWQQKKRRRMRRWESIGEVFSSCTENIYSKRRISTTSERKVLGFLGFY